MTTTNEPTPHTSPTYDDMTTRWLPTPQQMAVAAAMLAAEPEATRVLVGLALPGKTRGVWVLGQPVEAAPGFWLASDTGVARSYSHAREAADRSAGEQLGERPGCTSYAVIDRGGHAAVFEGIYGRATA